MSVYCYSMADDVDAVVCADDRASSSTSSVALVNDLPSSGWRFVVRCVAVICVFAGSQPVFFICVGVAIASLLSRLYVELGSDT